MGTVPSAQEERLEHTQGRKEGRRPRAHLIQQNDVRSLEDGAGNGDALLLPAAQLQSPLAHLCPVPCGYYPPHVSYVEETRNGGNRGQGLAGQHQEGRGLSGKESLTFRESHNGIMDACSLSSSLHLIIPSCDTAVTDIVGDGVIKEDSVLGHNSNVRPERGLGHLGPKDHTLCLVRYPQGLGGRVGWPEACGIRGCGNNPTITAPNPSRVGKSLLSVSPSSLPASPDCCRCFVLFLDRVHSVTQAGLQWQNLSLLQP